MMRRKGKARSQCESYGRAAGVGDYSMAARNHEPQLAAGVDFDVFTGQ
jgi:hypothetical protein